MIGDVLQRSAAQPNRSCWPRRELAASPPRRVGYKVLRSKGPEPNTTLCVRQMANSEGLLLVLVWSGPVRAWEWLQGQAVVAEEGRCAMVCYLNLIF